ncbi:MAG: hydrogenase maturation protease [candidate division KSB1 bacterium]|nr:hydrogenase maturation protease [candidate division KSB1 bacterium]MDZ7300515.1 hydrogenase maturation protease [candidate division KSB1 bacterium]MDZ7309654.1 hydrogenase maturation protease [candidate division KSB1 bacterium]
MAAHTRILIIGIGNEYRRDDAAGLVVARRLQKVVPSHVTVIEQSGEGAALLEGWKDTEVVFLIDAVHSGAAPGTIFRFDATTQPIPTKFFHYSTHAFSVAEAIELARSLNQLPSRLIVYGIEGKNFSSGVGLSPEVDNAVPEVERRVRQEIQSGS